MNIWVVVVVGGVTAWLSASVQRSSLSGLILGVGSVALGVALLVFNYNDAQRAQMGEALLLEANLAPLSRRQVRCTRPTWDCDRSTIRNGQVHVPFTCLRTPELQAAFREPVTCDELPAEVAGYLVDMNEAGQGIENWVVQVGGEPRRFPGPLSWIGLGFVALGFLVPAIARRARARRR